jgi:hypothetical protein
MLNFSGAGELAPAAFDAYLDGPVAARLDAQPAPGRWPVILGGLEGASIASDLGERLAGR